MKNNIKNPEKSIHWFYQDLRISDNQAFYNACASGQVLPVYILDDKNAGIYKMGAASRCWLHHALAALNDLLLGKLCFYVGDAQEIILNLVQENKISQVFWSRAYEPYIISQRKALKQKLNNLQVEVTSFNSAMLHEPWEITKADGSFYKVFTPFYNKALSSLVLEDPLPAPKKINITDDQSLQNINLSKLKLKPEKLWAEKLIKTWEISEQAAKKILNNFIKKDLNNYKEGRNFLAKSNISRLSPYLHFGLISPNYIYFKVSNRSTSPDAKSFLRQLYWREFSYNLLYAHPDMPKNNLQAKFDKFTWLKNSSHLKSWQKGLTGYPIIDAGMRELWQTGYMHNRVRMIVASFLVKNLLIHWHAGEQWFWDCLVDADLANNSASWQWVAGSGADAAPYYRIFNPITQGEKFDAAGLYTTKYVPELSALPLKYLFRPFEAPAHILAAAGVKLGQNYPQPIIDLKYSRERALHAFASLKT